jgi:hypothetical protein
MPIYGIQQTQANLNRIAATNRPDSVIAAAVEGATQAAHRYAIYVTHVDTGALKGAHAYTARGVHGEVYIRAEAQRSDGRRPAQYGPYEHARGGSHAFYARTVSEGASSIEAAANAAVRRYLR